MLGSICCVPKLWYFIFIISITSLIVYAQNTGGIIKGNILDASTNNPLSDVDIIVKNTQYGATSNSNGEFIINDLPPGQYEIIISAIGYKRFEKDHINVELTNPIVTTIRLNKDIIILPEVKIKANSSQIDPYEVTSINRLSYKEIKNIPGSFDDVIRTISILPGIGRADPVRNDLIVRGGSPSENLFLINGMPVPNINHYGNQGSTGGPVSFINLDYVNNVTFSAGGFSAAYGDKLSSVTNIDLKNGRTDHIGGKLVLSFSGFGFSSEGPINKNTSYIFSARKSFLDLPFRLTGFTFVPVYYDILSSIHTNLDNNSSISFLFLGSLDQVKFFEKSHDIRKDNPRAIGSEQLNYIGGIVYKKITNDGIYQISLNRNSNNYKTIPNLYFDNNSTEIENILKGNLIKKYSKNDEINIGFTGKLVEFNTALNLKNFRTSFNDLLVLDSTKFRKNFYKFEFFTQYNHRFNNGAVINLGIRYDYFNPLLNDYTISPRFSLSYPITYLLRFNFSTGIYYQTPSYIWLAGNPANRKLKSLRADHYISGLNYLLSDNIKLNAEIFYKYYSDYPASITRPYLVLANTGAEFSGIDDNFEEFGLEPLVSKGTGRSKGASFQMQSNLPSALYRIIFNVTYSDTYFRGLDKIKRTGNYDQRWVINFLTGYKFNDLMELNIKFNYASGKPYTPFNQNGIQEVSEYNALRFKSQHSLDIRINKDWIFSKWKLTTFLDVQNIYNRKNKNFINWDRVSNKIENDPVMGIIPSIGVITEL